MVILALALVGLLGAIALCTDESIIYFNWAELRNAADSAVMAGANYLPGNPNLAVSTANSFATQNGIATSEIVSTQVSQNNTEVTIVLRRIVPYYFARVLGLVSAPIQVTATAGIEATGGYGGNGNHLIPIGLDCPSGSCYTPGATVQFKQGQVGPGNWDPLALNANGGATYRDQIMYGYQGAPLYIGNYVATEPGNLVGPTLQGFDYRLQQSASMNLGDGPSDPNPNDPMVIEVPMVDFTQINGKSQVPITGFAELWIDSVDGSGSITATFIASVSADNIPSPTAPDYQSYAPVMLQ